MAMVLLPRSSLPLAPRSTVIGPLLASPAPDSRSSGCSRSLLVSSAFFGPLACPTSCRIAHRELSRTTASSSSSTTTTTTSLRRLLATSPRNNNLQCLHHHHHHHHHHSRRRQFMISAPLLFIIAEGSNKPSLAKAETSTNSPLINSSNSSKTVFVAGATGGTGKRIVKELLSKGFQVRAGVRDLQKAKAALPSSDNLEFVLADVTQSVELLAKAIGGVDAVIVATGFRPSFDLLASWKVDNWGTRSVVDACKLNQVKKIVLVSSILVNGAAIGQLLNPVYIILNIFGLTLVAKLQAENYIRKSGIDYTIIRPGGLKNDPPSGNIFLSREDSLYEGAVSRDTVARVAVESVSTPEASYKVVELVEKSDAPAKHVQELFASVS